MRGSRRSPLVSNVNTARTAEQGRTARIGCEWLRRFLKERLTNIRLRWFVRGLLTTGLVVFSPFAFGRGGAGGMGGAGQGQGYGGHYGNPFWSPYGYRGPASYDVGYTYTYPPSQEQQSTARKRVNDYLVAVHKGRRRAATHRYIAVETLRPTKTQREDYLKKRAQQKAPAMNPAQLRCLMVFDTQTKQFVGSGCYVVGSLPAPGAVTKFESVSAEFVGQGAL